MQQRAISVIASQFAILVLFGLHTLSAMSAETACNASAEQYWKTFRNAVLQNDLSTIVNLSSFPFEVRGILDENTKRTILREEFHKLFPSLLEADPGMSPTPTTMKWLLNTATSLSPSFCNAYENQFRVGTWVFELTSDGWRFIQAFVDE
ncbi:hypothetical protein [uncultured Thiodictyon sp.]|jgi:hypothetical protein|uniref:hypothetical protein n=1 Tax=uncultured Thiodictyon sp. TaxID=1846217 RepID=UPI0025FB7EE3|nr:hypothetical protein [uncultured Thiodictyon sp.]